MDVLIPIAWIVLGFIGMMLTAKVERISVYISTLVGLFMFGVMLGPFAIILAIVFLIVRLAENVKDKFLWEFK